MDPQLLFQWLVAVSHRCEDLPSLFNYELRSHPPALFESSYLPLQANKAILANVLWKSIEQQQDNPAVMSSMSLMSVLLPVLLTLPHITAKKTASVPAKNFISPSVCDENKPPRPSALLIETSVNFPPDNSLRPRE